MPGQNRRSALEIAVFAAALFLAVFLARELWRRWGAAPAAMSTQPIVLNLGPEATALKNEKPKTERAVTSVAPIRFSRIERRKPKPAVVPPPK